PALPPQPDGGRGLMPTLLTATIHRMCSQNRSRLLHQLAQTLCPFAFRQAASGRLTSDVVGWSGSHLLLTPVPDHKVTIAHTGIELDIVSSKFGVDCLD